MSEQLHITAQRINKLNFVAAPNLFFKNNNGAQISQKEQDGMHFANISPERSGATVIRESDGHNYASVTITDGIVRGPVIGINKGPIYGSTENTSPSQSEGLSEATIYLPNETRLVLTLNQISRVNFIGVSAIIAALNLEGCMVDVKESGLAILVASLNKSRLTLLGSNAVLGNASLSNGSRFIIERGSTCIPVATDIPSIISLLGNSEVDLDVPEQFPKLKVVSNDKNYSNALNTICLE